MALSAPAPPPVQKLSLLPQQQQLYRLWNMAMKGMARYTNAHTCVETTSYVVPPRTCTGRPAYSAETWIAGLSISPSWA